MHYFRPSGAFREAAERISFRAEDFVRDERTEGTWILPFSKLEQSKEAVELLQLYNKEKVS
jgi:hypothetical protein